MDRKKILHEYITENPKDEFSLYALAIEYIAINDFENANFYFSKLTEINSNYLPIYYAQGKMYEALGKIKEAVACYKTGVKIASIQKNNKTLGELMEALLMLDALDED